MYKKGQIIKVKVTNIKHYGFFFKTKDGWKGLVHISQLSENYVYNIEDNIFVGQDIDIYCLEVDKDKKQISGSYKKANIDDFKTKNFDSPKEFEIVKKNLPKQIDSKLKEIENN